MPRKSKQPTETVPAPVSPERKAKADELRPLLGQTLTLTWGIGSQQTKHITTGHLTGVDPEGRWLDMILPQRKTAPDFSSKPCAFRLPLSMLIRCAQ